MRHKQVFLPKRDLQKLRKLVRTAKWKQASSPAYRDAPHSYLIFFDYKRDWKWFAARIRMYGVYRTWRGHRYKYLLLDDEVFWVMWPVLNRAKASTLEST